jgi:hypothetical protein
MVNFSPPIAQRPIKFGLVYAWSGFAIMWAVWACFVIFLCESRGRHGRFLQLIMAGICPLTWGRRLNLALSHYSDCSI